MAHLIDLPVELLYELELYAASSALPRACKALYEVFKAAPASYRAQYLVARIDQSLTREHAITKILRFPLCNQAVLEAYLGMTTREAELWKCQVPELPRRLFRSLSAPSVSNFISAPGRAKGSPQWTERDHPLPFLRYLYSCPHILPPAVNSHDGYALTKAVQSGFIPLVRFLLHQGATPDWKNNLAVSIAIHRKDLRLVKMLVERVETRQLPEGKRTQGKRRRLEDRLVVTPEMLRAAVKCKAQDIVEYFTKEKGCIPDMQTLLMMQ
ncbi:hypothetical protein V8B97DRAFT_1948655 [Scleroderma yunnanense]